MLAPKTTVICAVWNRDPERYSLLESHSACLNRQTVPVDSIYVFDNGDAIPDNLKKQSIVVGKELTIYEAWNVALSMVRTPYVANLNLDDRFCSDGIATLERHLESSKADFVGGDWEVCFDRADVDRDALSYPSADLPFFPDWPPIHGCKCRLGSGTSDRGTFGPGVLWKMDVHIGMPRYPYRTNDGYLIKSVSDSLWWHMLSNFLKKKGMRIPIVIGKYLSSPSTQAEFRTKNEWSVINGKQISLL